MESLATPMLWSITLLGVLALFVIDFVVTRKPHEVSMKEAAAWSGFYIALPVAFGIWLWAQHGGEIGSQFFTGYVVEKSLSVDNLFIFLLLLGAFAVPKALQQRVLLIGVAGALVMRAVMIVIGAQLLTRFVWMCALFGAFLLWTAFKVWRDAGSEGHGGEGHGSEGGVEPGEMRLVRVLRRFFPVTDDYRGTAMTVRVDEAGREIGADGVESAAGGAAVSDGAAGAESDGDAGAAGAGRTRRALTPLAVVTLVVLATDALFALDSVPAVYGITGDPYLVFVTNAFALLGLSALYFVVEGVLGRLVHLGYVLAVILAFIGYKLVAHWAHENWSWVWMPSTAVSLSVIVVSLVTVTISSLAVTRRAEHDADPDAAA